MKTYKIYGQNIQFKKGIKELTEEEVSEAIEEVTDYVLENLDASSYCDGNIFFHLKNAEGEVSDEDMSKVRDIAKHLVENDLEFFGGIGNGDWEVRRYEDDETPERPCSAFSTTIESQDIRKLWFD